MVKEKDLKNVPEWRKSKEIQRVEDLEEEKASVAPPEFETPKTPTSKPVLKAKVTTTESVKKTQREGKKKLKRSGKHGNR